MLALMQFIFAVVGATVIVGAIFLAPLIIAYLLAMLAVPDRQEYDTNKDRRNEDDK